MTRIRKTADIDLARFNPKDAERLLAFNVTKQRIVDLANQYFDLPWEDEKNYSTWHRALDGHEVWEQIVVALEGLYEDQVRDPRKFLPGPPDQDDLAAWMKQIAGAKWWCDVLRLDMPVNTLTGWMSGRSISKERIDTVRERVNDWWERVDRACHRADLVRTYHARQRAEHEPEPRVDGGRIVNAHGWDSYFYTYVHEDGHSVDEARAHYVEMASLARDHWLALIDLTDPQDPCRRWSESQESFYAQEFDAIWKRGLPQAIPRKPPVFSTEPRFTVKRWPDRRAEEAPKDLNEALYGLWFKERAVPFWDEDNRWVSARSEIVEVSQDGETWRAATDRERQGWDNGGEMIARYRHEHGEAPDNSYRREVAEAQSAVHRARQAYNLSGSDEDFFALEAAERALEHARNDY